jgi:hypothetical protein
MLVDGEEAEGRDAHLCERDRVEIFVVVAGAVASRKLDAPVDVRVERLNLFNHVKAGQHRHLVVHHNDGHHVLPGVGLVEVFGAAIYHCLAVVDEVAEVRQTKLGEDDLKRLEVVIDVVCADDGNLFATRQGAEGNWLAHQLLDLTLTFLRRPNVIHGGAFGHLLHLRNAMTHNPADVAVVWDLDVDPERELSHVTWLRLNGDVAAEVVANVFADAETEPVTVRIQIFLIAQLREGLEELLLLLRGDRVSVVRNSHL